MRVQWRRLGAGELDHELIWLAVTLLAAAGVASWWALHLPWPGCTFRALFGVPCLTCGSTRAAQAFLHGDFLTAWRFNPLAALAFWGVAVFDLYALAVLTSGSRRLRITPRNAGERRALVILILSALLLNWLYLLRAG